MFRTVKGSVEVGLQGCVSEYVCERERQRAGPYTRGRSRGRETELIRNKGERERERGSE